MNQQRQPEVITSIGPPLIGPVVMRQRWSEVSFLHWRISPGEAAPFMPAGTVPDVVDGTSWVGLIGFQMSESAFLRGPRVPWLGNFPEVNVRLYSADEQGRRGVVFRSLEASRLFPVLFARTVFGLQYQWASMRLERHEGAVHYRTARRWGTRARSQFAVRPLDASVTAEDRVATALTARWAFHERHLGQTLYCQNHHEPWPLKRGELVYLNDELLAAAGFPHIAHRPPDSVLFSPGVHTQFALPERVKPRRG